MLRYLVVFMNPLAKRNPLYLIEEANPERAQAAAGRSFVDDYAPDEVSEWQADVISNPAEE